MNIKDRKSTEFLFPCCKLGTNFTETFEIKCVERFKNYYINNKIKKYSINFEKQFIIDTTINSSPEEIKPSPLYFEIIEKMQKENTNISNRNITHFNPLIAKIPFPLPQIELESGGYLEYPYICYNYHPITGNRINLLEDDNISNLLFNDIIQESGLILNKNFEILASEFLCEISSEEKILINLIKIITDEGTFFNHMNSILINQTALSFLGSFILVLNKCIRNDKLSLRENRRIFRKAHLTEKEITEYHKIFKSEKKKFHWNSLVTGYLENSAYLNSNDYHFNTIFIIEFKGNSFGINIEKFSLTKIESEILLPAMSVFFIKSISLIKNDQKQEIVQIELYKIDGSLIENFQYHKVPEKKKVKSYMKPQDSKNVKMLKILNNEILLLNFFQKKYSTKFTFLQDPDNKFLLKFLIIGPQNSPYEDGWYHLNLEILEEYPNVAPKVKFMTYIWHPNIIFKEGIVFNKLLNNKWKSSFSLINVIESVFGMLNDPDKSVFLTGNKEAYFEYFNEKEVFLKKAIEINAKYAMNYINLLNNPHNKKDFFNTENKKFFLSTDALVTRDSDLKKIKSNKFNERYKDSDNETNYNDNKSNNSKLSKSKSEIINTAKNTIKSRISNNVMENIISPLSPSKSNKKKSIGQEIIKIDLRDRKSLHSKSSKSMKSLDLENALNFENLSIRSIMDQSDRSFTLEQEGKIYYRKLRLQTSEDESGITPLYGKRNFEKVHHENYEVDCDSKKDIDISYLN